MELLVVVLVASVLAFAQAGHEVVEDRRDVVEGLAQSDTRDVQGTVNDQQEQQWNRNISRERRLEQLAHDKTDGAAGVTCSIV